MYAQKATQYRPENDLFTNQKIGILLKPLVHGFGRRFKRFSLLLNLEIGILLTRLVTGFGRKFEVFSFFYFRSKQKQNQFGNALDRKQLYIDQKNKLFSGSKNWHSSKAVSRLVHGFKLEIFPIFFYQNRNSYKKFQIESNPIQTRKMTFLLNRKIGTLLKELVHGFGRKLKRFSFFFRLKQEPITNRPLLKIK